MLNLHSSPEGELKGIQGHLVGMGSQAQGRLKAPGPPRAAFLQGPGGNSTGTPSSQEATYRTLEATQDRP